MTLRWRLSSSPADRQRLEHLESEDALLSRSAAHPADFSTAAALALVELLLLWLVVRAPVAAAFGLQPLFSPATSDAQESSTVFPSGLTMPRPVMTTRPPLPSCSSISAMR